MDRARPSRTHFDGPESRMIRFAESRGSRKRSNLGIARGSTLVSALNARLIKIRLKLSLLEKASTLIKSLHAYPLRARYLTKVYVYGKHASLSVSLYIYHRWSFLPVTQISASVRPFVRPSAINFCGQERRRHF